MGGDPHFFGWLGWVVSWVVFPLVAISAFLRYRNDKKKIDVVIGVACIVLFIARIFRY